MRAWILGVFVLGACGAVGDHPSTQQVCTQLAVGVCEAAFRCPKEGADIVAQYPSVQACKSDFFDRCCAGAKCSDNRPVKATYQQVDDCEVQLRTATCGSFDLSCTSGLAAPLNLP